MNAFKENKFLAGFLGVMVVATGGLGFLLFSASGRYSDTMAAFEDEANQLYALQTKAPYPNQENLDKMKVQAKEYQGAVEALQKSLLSNQLPIEPITPVLFQDKLKESVARVTAKAAEKGVKLPEKFYMGFDPYQFEPPQPEAAPLLGKQLKALELVMMILLDSRVNALVALDRVPLPEEGIDKARAGNSKSDNNSREKESSAKPLVTKRMVTLGFVGEQSAFRKILNDLTSSKEQFYIPRRINVKNEKLTGPSKLADNATAAAAYAPTPFVDPNAPATAVPQPAAPKAPQLKYIVGQETIDVTMQLEIIDFANPSVK